MTGGAGGVLGAPPAPLVARQLLPAGAGCPRAFEPPTMSNIGGSQLLAPVGAGQPDAGQLNSPGT
ncbi:MAG TPA: hypothetical protein VMT03_00050, partial [Polyangia bacterium]|nr:hypothetical protein [Polyangia bacterium]